MNIQTFVKIIILSALAGLFASGAFAQEVAHGNGALEIFDQEGIANSPAWVRAWVGFMLATFVVGLIFAFIRPEARFVMAPIILGFAVLIILSAGFGYAFPEVSGFIALLHLIFWTPTLIMLLRNRWFLKESTWFGRWTGVLTFVILFSFIFDIRDAAIYLDHIAGLGLF